MKTKIVIGVILLLLALSYWMIETIIAQQNLHKNSPGTPDAIVHKATYSRSNSDGQITDRLTAQTVYHYSHNDTSKLLNPTLILYNPNQPPWIVTAKLAIATQGTNKVVLINDVKITQHQKSGDTVLTTNKLTVWPNRKFAKTLDAVTITQPDSVVHAQGLTANFKTGVIHLLAKARGHYAPK